MPRQRIIDLKNAIEAAPEMTSEHREQLLALVASLATEVETVEGAEDGARTERVRGAIAVAEDVVRKRAGGEDSAGDHDLGERLAELEEKAEMIALEHPVIANVLNAIARLV